MARISINSLLGTEGPNYAEAIASPYREELTRVGFEQLLSPSEVDAALDSRNDDIQLVVLNSVCGCAARVARPGAILSLVSDLVPDRRLTLFAGMEKEAVAHFREKYLPGITPSSPNIAIFKNGALQFILQRYQVESMTAEAIAKELLAVEMLIAGKSLAKPKPEPRPEPGPGPVRHGLRPQRARQGRVLLRQVRLLRQHEQLQDSVHPGRPRGGGGGGVRSQGPRAAAPDDRHRSPHR